MRIKIDVWTNQTEVITQFLLIGPTGYFLMLRQKNRDIPEMNYFTPALPMSLFFIYNFQIFHFLEKCAMNVIFIKLVINSSY